jgi:pilus assembly protein CpaB
LKSKALSMFIIALLLAGGAAWLANRWVARLEPSRSAQPATEKVVVAALKIPFAQKIEAPQLKMAEWPRGSVPEGTFSDPAQVIGKVANQTIVVNEPVLQDRVVEHLGGSTLSAFIERRKRAVSVRVNDVTGVGGFVLPGNVVDVVKAQKDGRSHILLENIKVLAVDQEASPDKDKPAVVRAVTLELTPDEVETLVGATQEGEIHLALRNPLDNALIGREQQRTVAAATPPAVVKEPEKHWRTLTIIRGDKVDVYENR